MFYYGRIFLKNNIREDRLSDFKYKKILKKFYIFELALE